jgi:phosphatidylglycerol---prolipoprotein diacylglyceryl transferase
VAKSGSRKRARSRAAAAAGPAGGPRGSQAAGGQVVPTGSAEPFRAKGTRATVAAGALPPALAARPAGAAAPPAGAAARPAAVPAGPPAGGADAPDTGPDWAVRALEKVLTPTYWLDPGAHGDPFPVTVRFSGRRQGGVPGKPGPDDSFTREQTFEAIVPGSGPVAVTAEVRGTAPGDWTVTARPVARAGVRVVPAATAAKEPQGWRVPWPRRVDVPDGPPVPARAVLLPFAPIPGITRFVYPALVAAGVLAGLALQSLLLAVAGFSWTAALAYSLYAVAAGLAGAKAWYIATHQWRKFDGWCVQGFAAGAAALAATAPAAGLGIPAGAYYAAAAAGLLAGMGTGRPGCFWAGCCTGRPTASRWGIWSSDRRTGCRRVPVQFMEAALALAAGTLAAAAMLLAGPARSGPAAIAALAVYTLGRQFLLDLRADPPRRSPHGGHVTAAISAAVLISGLALLAAGGW